MRTCAMNSHRNPSSVLKNSLRGSSVTSVAEATVDFATLTARLEAAPFQNKNRSRVFQPGQEQQIQSTHFLLIAVAGIDRDQFQRLEQRARFGDEFDVPTFRARQDGMSMPAIGDETDSHELVTLQLLFAP